MIERFWRLALESRGLTAGERKRIDRAVRRDLRRRFGANLSATPCVQLSTCVRREWYGFGPPPRRPVAAGVQPQDGRAAFTHLLRVAAGLLSPIPGEPQILGQVRRAYLAACAAGRLAPELDAALRAAIHAGRRVRSETAFGRLCRGYADLAIEALGGTANDGRVVVIGTGQLAEQIARRLQARAEIVIVSRHAGRAADVAAEVGGRWASPEDLPNWLSVADAVVACTQSVAPVLRREHLLSTPRSLHVIDLGEPPNVAADVDVSCGALVTRLWQLVPLQQRDEGRAEAERIVQVEVDRYADWLARRARRRVIPLTAGEPPSTVANETRACPGVRTHAI